MTKRRIAWLAARILSGGKIPSSLAQLVHCCDFVLLADQIHSSLV
jgi:hypothetical protein